MGDWKDEINKISEEMESEIRKKHEKILVDAIDGIIKELESKGYSRQDSIMIALNLFAIISRSGGRD